MPVATTIRNCAHGRWRVLPMPSETPTLNEAARYFAEHGTPLKRLTKKVSSDCRKRSNKKRLTPAGTLPLADRQPCAAKCCDWPADATALLATSFSEGTRVRSSRNHLTPPTNSNPIH